MEGRTDLALEAAQAVQGASRLPGVWSEEREEDGVKVTAVEIRDEEAAKAVGKPMGRYVTLELEAARRREKAAFGRACGLLAKELGKMIPDGDGPVLVVGLGNRNITPDAIGPLAHGHLLVTRHLIAQLPEVFGSFRPVAAISAGVLGTTGMESAELVKAVAEKIRPDCVVAIDALAARGMKRLCATVQIANTGIAPGSGVGNHREALNQETLGVPVVAVGVPTVVEVCAVVRDVLEEVGREDLEPKAVVEGGGFVTTRDIDERVAQWGKLIGYAVNMAVQKGLSLEDIEGLAE